MLKKEFRFEASHRLGFHTGKCRNVHGHQWRVIVGLDGEQTNNMVIDFYKLKMIIWPVINELDHSFIFNTNDDLDSKIAMLLRDNGLKIYPLTKYPTCEYLAKHLYEELEGILGFENLKINEVEVYESEGSSFVYTLDKHIK